MDAVGARSAVVFDSCGGRLVSGGSTVDVTVFAFGGGHEAVGPGGAARVVLNRESGRLEWPVNGRNGSTYF